MRRSTPSDCQTDSSTGTAATTGNQLQPQQQLTHVSFDDDSCDSNRWGKNGLDRLPTIQFSPTERNAQQRPISSFLVQSFLPFGFHLFLSYWFIRSLLRKKKSFSICRQISIINSRIPFFYFTIHWCLCMRLLYIHIYDNCFLFVFVFFFCD